MSGFDAQALVKRLASMAEILPMLVEGLSDDEAKWKPAPDQWSVLEVFCHLADEEEEDFRPRLERTLSDPLAEWPPLDLENVAQRRGYNDRDLARTVEKFSVERRASVNWLRSLSSPDWNLAHAHPKIGAIRAGDLLASWAAHDAIHLRQIAKRLHGLAVRDGGEFKTAYAEG